MGQDTQLSEPRTPPPAPAPSATRRGGREPQTQSRTPHPALRQVLAPRTAWPRRGSAGGLQMGKRVEARTSAWPRRDGGDGLLGRGGNVHTRRAQARAHVGAGAGASRRHRWASAAARPGCSRRHLAHAPRSAAVPPALCWPGPWKGPSSWVSPLPCRPLAAPSPGRPLPLPSLATARHRGAARALLPAGIAPRYPPSLLSHVLGLPDVLALRATAGRPSPRGSGGSLGAAADVASAPTLHSVAQAGRRAATRHVRGKCRNAQRGGARKER